MCSISAAPFKLQTLQTLYYLLFTTYYLLVTILSAVRLPEVRLNGSYL